MIVLPAPRLACVSRQGLSIEARSWLRHPSRRDLGYATDEVGVGLSLHSPLGHGGVGCPVLRLPARLRGGAAGRCAGRKL